MLKDPFDPKSRLGRRCGCGGDHPASEHGRLTAEAVPAGEEARWNRVVDAAVPVSRRGIVIGRGDDRIDAPWLAPGELQPIERLRARHFVDEVAVDVEQRRTVAFAADDVAIPELVVKRAGSHGSAGA